MKNLSLHDSLKRPLSDLRISVIDRCNFRCPYCMPEEHYHKHYQFLKPDQWLSFEEITRLTRIFYQLGVKKFRITGGEPLLRPNIDKLIQSLAAIIDSDDLALTTNGSLLKEHAKNLKMAGLKRLTISLDAIDDQTFKLMSGNKGKLQDVLSGIDAAEAAGFKHMKINAVIQRTMNDKDILALVDHFRGTPHILRFIEYMDVGNCNHWQADAVYPSHELRTLIEKHYPLKSLDENYFGEVAQRYAYTDGKGEVGFISSISQPFCQTCTRARLSTDGKIYTCLFAHRGADLKFLLDQGSSDEEIATFISQVWSKRTDRYSELRKEFFDAQPQRPKVEMFQIGG